MSAVKSIHILDLDLFFFFFFKEGDFSKNLFIFGCAGLCCCSGFLWLWRAGASLCCCAWISSPGLLLWCMGLEAPRHVESSQARDQTHVPYIGRWILIPYTTREILDHCLNIKQYLKQN